MPTRYLCLFLFALMTHSVICRTIYVDFKIEVKACESYNPLKRDCKGLNLLCFNELQPAIEASKYGDTILVRGGFYPEQLVINLKYDTNGYLTLMNYSNEQVFIDGNNPNIGPLIKIESDRIKIKNLNILHSKTFGIISNNTKDIWIENCEVSYSNDGGIVFVDAGNIYISNCNVHHNNYRGLIASHEGITMHNVNTFEIHECVVHDNREEGIDAKYGSELGKIYNNKVYRNNGPNIYIDKANQIEIFNNVVHSAVAKAGISLNIESAYHREGLPWTLQYVKIYNNLIYNNHGGIGFWLEPGNGQEKQALWDHIQIINNTIVNNSYEGESRGGGIYFLNPKSENFGEDIIIRNNIFTGNAKMNSKSIWDQTGEILTRKFTIDHNLFISGEHSDTFGEESILTDDPGFINLKEFDFSLLYASPAIDKGSLLNSPEKDFTGMVRSNGKSCDIGAFEFKR